MLNTEGYERIKRNLRNNRLQTINVMVLKRVLCCFFLQLRISFDILFFRRSLTLRNRNVSNFPCKMACFYLFCGAWLCVCVLQLSRLTAAKFFLPTDEFS